ncbi:hypothetical protein AGLY_012599 [Aphis glycines]|uniref:Ig-like domain-containing protein n=1 Tax=Aphis glycines TaxID=307491 RepID=A0A6G0T8U9_APHGL|nr:hypothetical protein AGLY_012599 [Aphis glycines]
MAHHVYIAFSVLQFKEAFFSIEKILSNQTSNTQIIILNYNIYKNKQIVKNKKKKNNANNKIVIQNFIRFNGVQNFKIFIDHFESRKNCASATLKCEFCKTFSYCTLNLWYECTVKLLSLSAVNGPWLNVSKVNRLHMGAYLCIASNGIPPSVSKLPPMIWIQNQLVGAQEGQSVTLECMSEAFPKSIDYWTKDKTTIISNGTKYHTDLKDNVYKTHMKLTIISVTSSDYGTYQCVSKNSLGETDGTIKLYGTFMQIIKYVYLDYNHHFLLRKIKNEILKKHNDRSPVY